MIRGFFIAFYIWVPNPKNYYTKLTGYLVDEACRYARENKADLYSLDGFEKKGQISFEMVKIDDCQFGGNKKP